jgi:putative DNA primase/helicase
MKHSKCRKASNRSSRKNVSDTRGVSDRSKSSKMPKAEGALPAVLARALEYASQGLPVLPMHSCKDGVCSCHKGKRCDRPGKHPLSANGVKDATTKRSLIKKWFTQWPTANVGIAPGAKAGILVLDVDPRNRGGETFATLEQELGKLPETVTAFTGGSGFHLVFKHPEFLVRKDSSGKVLGAGVDILTDGSIMIAPPSRHASGKKYGWAGNGPYRKLELAALPGAWLKRLQENRGAEPRAATGGLVTEGGRNDHLTSIAGKLRRDGVTGNELTTKLKRENAESCSPPLDDAEVEKIVDSVSKYPPHNGTGDNVDPAERLAKLTLEQHFASGQHLIFGVEGRFWHYQKRVWVVAPEAWVSGKLLKTAKANPAKGHKTAPLLGQALALMKAELAAKDDVLGFSKDPAPVINCRNGEVWILPDGNVELRSHRAQSHLRHCLDVDFDQEAVCPKYDRALLEIFEKSGKPKAMARHWNELMGYIIQPRRHIPLVGVLRGGGDNGKTVLVRTLVRLLGAPLVQAQTVESLDKSRFAMGSLFGKLLFVDDDVKAGIRLPDGILKTISEAKEVTGELKYQQPFNFVVRTVPLLLCNNVPSLADLSHGMRRRLMVFPFDRQFTEDEKDPDLFEAIWAKELSGVLNRGLAGYQRLVRRGSLFKRPSPVTDATNLWLQHANPLPAFIEANCLKGAGEWCLVRTFYEAYADWAREMGFTLVQTQNAMTRNLEHLGYGTKKTNKGVAVIGLALVSAGA